MARRGKFRSYLTTLLVLGAAGLIVAAGLATFRIGPPPVVSIEPQTPGIGRSTPVEVSVDEPLRGLVGFRVELEQGASTYTLDQRKYLPIDPWKFWGPRTERDRIVVAVGSETVEGLREGEATLRVVAERAGTWLRSPQPVVAEQTLPVMLRPPSLLVQSTQSYVSQGGCEAVVYRVGKSSVEDGVRSGSWWFPGYPLPGGGERDRFALFAAPYDLEDPQQIQLESRDVVGNVARANIVDRFSRKPLRTDTIPVSDRFMQRVVPAIMDQTPGLTDRGSLLDNYLQINRDLRKRNSETLTELARQSNPQFLWSETFMQMRNAKVTSSFADRRTYVYEGQAVDQQDHLGFDLASTARADIEAANDGVVVLARYFGIYGNAVVIDHGYGLLSLYGHLSSIAVEEGQSVVRAELVGRSGVTGLAGGDHLHFTILLQGLPVDPREWWDGHWLRDRLKRKLDTALPFDG